MLSVQVRVRLYIPLTRLATVPDITQEVKEASHYLAVHEIVPFCCWDVFIKLEAHEVVEVCAR